MSYLYAFTTNFFDDDCFAIGWFKVACWKDLTLNEKKFFLKVYGKENLMFRYKGF